MFSPLIERAIELAAEWHDGTYRKSRWRPPVFDIPSVEVDEGEPVRVLRVPVMAHVTTVAFTVQRAGWDDETVAAAFLHDTVEDCNRYGQGLTLEALAAATTSGVAERVRAVTEPKKAASGRFLPWQVRKEAYVEQLANGSDEAAAISLADKLHNLWTMNQGLAAGRDIFTRARHADGSPRGLSAGPTQQQWYFQAVLGAVARFADPRLEPQRMRLREEMARFDALVGERTT
ncbi:MAG: HD domain-containing protein [Bacteroidota bacterium]